MKVNVAATQMSCSWDLSKNIEKAIRIIRQAAHDGANIILLQELFQSPYFCIEYDEKIFELAQTFENNKVIEEMSELCKSDREKRKNLRKYQKCARFVSEIVPRVSPIWNLCA